MMKSQICSSKKSKTASRTSNTITDTRHKVTHDYHDHSHVTFPSDAPSNLESDGEKRKGPRGGVTVPFPTKLHVMLSKVEESGLGHIVSWQPHGRCFVVHKPKEFVAEVMPTYFRQSKLTSFQRQLNLYGFARITAGRDRGGYYHEYFLQHKLFLCQKMSRIRIKGTGIKGKASPETEPDFYSMPFVQPEVASMDYDRDLEGEVEAAMEEDNKKTEQPPTSSRQPRSRRQQEASYRKKRHVVAMNSRKGSEEELLDTDDCGYSSPRSDPLLVHVASALVSPDIRSTKQHICFHNPSAFEERSPIPSSGNDKLLDRRLSQCGQPSIFDLCPPFVLSDSDDTNTAEEEPHSGDAIAFEGKHFHYLDSFVASQPDPSHHFALEPRRSSHRSMALSHSSMSVALSLREPIMTPSSSSSSLCGMLKQDGPSIEINPDTIFSESDGDWHLGVGEDLDIAHEFAMLAR